MKQTKVMPQPNLLGAKKRLGDKLGNLGVRIPAEYQLHSTKEAIGEF